jgi:Na+-transporting NADH:ubiquinone oxidoreductase subunit NqrE
MWEQYANLFIKSIFIENMVFAYFLGMCSYLAISKTLKNGVGMGLAVIFVLTITVPLNSWKIESKSDSSKFFDSEKNLMS